MVDERPLVLHVITLLELGGAQQNTLYSVAHHDRDRFRVALLAGKGGVLDEDALRIPDAEVRLLPSLRREISPVGDPVALVALARAFRRMRPAIVHTHSSKAGILGRLAARLARVPRVVHTVHGWSFNDTQPRPVRTLYRSLERVAARATDRIVCVSERDRETGIALGIGSPDRYALVRSGIDLAEFAPRPERRAAVRAALGVAEGEILVGAVACLKPQKAPLDLVEAAASARARDPRLRFVLAGDGELRGPVEERARSLGLGESFRILGWRRDVPDLLAAMDLFLLTSLFEGLPRSVLQAMSAGVPIVATAAGGTPEVVRDRETGRLVPPGRPAEAAEAILDLAADLEGRTALATAARRRIGEEFDIRGMVRRLDRLYEEILRPSTARVGSTPETL